MFFSFVETHSFLFGLQKPTDKIFGEIIIFVPNLFIKVDLPLENVGDGIGMVLGFEGSIAGDKSIYSHAQGPQIDSFIVAASNIHFGC